MTDVRELTKGLIRDIENLDALDDLSESAAAWVRRATRPDPVKNALSGTWLGHQLHPMLTDVPIGAWLMASTLDWTAGESAAGAARRLVGLGVLAAVPTAAAGASDWSDGYGAEQRVGLVHAGSNLTATLLQVASWLARRRGRRVAGMTLSTVGLGITVSASYLGGYLSFNRGVGVSHTAFQPTVTDWTDVAALTDVSVDKPVRVAVGDVPVVLVRHDGAIVALSATCAHAGGPLDEGAIDRDGCIRCPWHSSIFRLADGTVVRGPAAVNQPSWDVKVDEGRVYVRSAASESTG